MDEGSGRAFREENAVSAFRTIPGGELPLRAIVIGAGARSRAWLTSLVVSEDVKIVGLVDLDTAVAKASADAAGLPGIPVATSISQLLTEVSADVAINLTVPAAHYVVSSEALRAGLPVLSEKPLTPTVAEGIALAAIAEDAGQLLMVSQTKRYYRGFKQLQDVVGQMGRVGTVNVELFRGMREGGFPEKMAHPVLLDMSIHAFDGVRYLLDDEPVSVYCEEFNPPWSWYAGDAVVMAHFVTAGGVRFTYTGSWCSPGLETSWNGRWRVSAEHGSALWDGEGLPSWESEVEVNLSDSVDVAEDLAGSLVDFVSSIRTGTVPSSAARSNILSLAMVEAALRSSETGSRVNLKDVIDAGLEQAIARETAPGVLKILHSWADEGF